MRHAKKYIYRILQRTGREVVRTGELPRSFFDSLLECAYWAAAQRGDRCSVVQIGANDGMTNDPIAPFLRYRKPDAVLIEPQKDVFEKLLRNYSGHENLRFANVAIAESDGTIPMYRIAPSFHDSLRALYRENANPSGVTSFSRSHVEGFLKQSAPAFFASHDVSEFVVPDEVEACTISTLLQRFQIAHVDVLQIDAEGYDFEIIKMWTGSSAVLPTLINYEHKSLSKSDQESCANLLLGLGYSVFRHRGDTCAFRALSLDGVS